MKFIYLTLLISTILLSNSCTSSKENFSTTKYQSIITKYTEIKQIISKEVDDTFYVYIRLPKNYNKSNKSYPVLYLLDGDISFNMATSIVRYLQFDKSVPDLIIVAPAYGTMMSNNEKNFRERDYTFSSNSKFKKSGGGSNYLKFFTNELIPKIDSSYRTNNKRILNGYSLGGLFAMNAMLEDPKTFNNVIAGSPYLINDLNLFDEMVNGLKKHSGNKKIFISYGELEDKTTYHKPIKNLAGKLKSVNGLSIKLVEFKNGTHLSCPSEAMTYGLKYIFKSQ
ncbi:MAG: alpha/beta hydrolase-fold protein [Melioribacteraceae bacterium]